VEDELAGILRSELEASFDEFFEEGALLFFGIIAPLLPTQE
jgi:hypothetical protein